MPATTCVESQHWRSFEVVESHAQSEKQHGPLQVDTPRHNCLLKGGAPPNKMLFFDCMATKIRYRARKKGTG